MDLALDNPPPQLPSPSTSDTNNASPNKDLDLKQMKLDDLRQWLSQQGDLSNPVRNGKRVGSQGGNCCEVPEKSHSQQKSKTALKGFSKRSCHILHRFDREIEIVKGKLKKDHCLFEMLSRDSFARKIQEPRMGKKELKLKEEKKELELQDEPRRPSFSSIREMLGIDSADENCGINFGLDETLDKVTILDSGEVRYGVESCTEDYEDDCSTNDDGSVLARQAEEDSGEIKVKYNTTEAKPKKADSKISYADMHAKRASLCSPPARSVLRKPVTNKARKDSSGVEAKKDSLSLVGGDTKASNQTSGTGSSDRSLGGPKTTIPSTDSLKKSQLPRAQEKIKASETQYPSYTTSSHYLQASSAASMHSFSHTSTISGQAIPPGHSVASTTIPIMNTTSAQGPANNSVPNSMNPSSGKSTSESTIIRKEGGARLKRKAPVVVKHQSSSWSRRRWMCLMFFMIVLFAALSSGATVWYLQQLEKRRQRSWW